MQDTKFKALPCKISRGGFSDERVFSIILDSLNYAGVASRRYFWTSDQEALPEGEPPIGQEIVGIVAAHVIETRPDGTALVSVPDGEVITVPVRSLLDRPCKAEAHVPVGS